MCRQENEGCQKDNHQSSFTHFLGQFVEETAQELLGLILSFFFFGAFCMGSPKHHDASAAVLSQLMHIPVFIALCNLSHN